MLWIRRKDGWSPSGSSEHSAQRSSTQAVGYNRNVHPSVHDRAIAYSAPGSQTDATMLRINGPRTSIRSTKYYGAACLYCLTCVFVRRFRCWFLCLSLRRHGNSASGGPSPSLLKVFFSLCIPVCRPLLREGEFVCLFVYCGPSMLNYGIVSRRIQDTFFLQETKKLAWPLPYDIFE